MSATAVITKRILLGIWKVYFWIFIAILIIIQSNSKQWGYFSITFEQLIGTGKYGCGHSGLTFCSPHRSLPEFFPKLSRQSNLLDGMSDGCHSILTSVLLIIIIIHCFCFQKLAKGYVAPTSFWCLASTVGRGCLVGAAYPGYSSLVLTIFIRLVFW